jgi:hypothetical protein
MPAQGQPFCQMRDNTDVKRDIGTFSTKATVNSPRINEQCTSLSWFVVSLHTIDMYLFIYNSEEYMYIDLIGERWLNLRIIASTGTSACPVLSPVSIELPI